MSYDKNSLINSLIESGFEIARKGLVWGNSGNISHRLNDDNFIISGSGAYLENLSENDFVTMNLQDEKWKGRGKPSIETKMHREIYKTKKDVNAVLHSQPFFTTLISCTSLEIDINLFPESMAYLVKVDRVPYDHPGSSELAKSVSENIINCDILILSNHGAICAADCLENLILKTETLEMLCKMISLSKVGDMELKYLPQEIQDEFLRHLEEIK
jgi:L-fuculose-phosphate aldolase